MQNKWTHTHTLACRHTDRPRAGPVIKFLHPNGADLLIFLFTGTGSFWWFSSRSGLALLCLHFTSRFVRPSLAALQFIAPAVENPPVVGSTPSKTVLLLRIFLLPRASSSSRSFASFQEETSNFPLFYDDSKQTQPTPHYRFTCSSFLTASLRSSHNHSHTLLLFASTLGCSSQCAHLLLDLLSVILFALGELRLFTCFFTKFSYFI